MFGANVVDKAVLGDPHEPAGEAALGGIESVSGPPRADEYLLGDVLGAVVAQRAATEGVDEGAVGVVRGWECVVVPLRKCRLSGIDNPQLCRRHMKRVPTRLLGTGLRSQEDGGHNGTRRELDGGEF